jgi:signal peptidase II
MRVLFLTLGLLAADFASKLAVRGISLPSLGITLRGLDYGVPVPLLGDWLKLTFVENPSMAFGMELMGKEFRVAFTLLASIALLWYLYRHRRGPLLLRLAIACILAGAFGNLVDRTFFGLLYGYAGCFQGNVVDFIDLDLFTVQIAGGYFKVWPIFNVADACVTVGVAALILGAGRLERERLRAARSASAVTPSGDVVAPPDSR